MSSSIILLLPLLLLLILHSIDAWTPRLSASHFNSGGRFFHNAHGNTTPLSLKATENNHSEEEDTSNNNNNNEDEFNNKEDNNQKKGGTYLKTAEYLSQLESLYASSSSSAAAVTSSSLSSTYSLLESLVEDHSDTTSTASTSSTTTSTPSSSPGQSLLYGEKIHTVVLGDWMEWEGGEVVGGKNSYSSGSSSSSCFGENCGDDSEVRERKVLCLCLLMFYLLLQIYVLTEPLLFHQS